MPQIYYFLRRTTAHAVNSRRRTDNSTKAKLSKLHNHLVMHVSVSSCNDWKPLPYLTMNSATMAFALSCCEGVCSNVCAVISKPCQVKLTSTHVLVSRHQSWKTFVTIIWFNALAYFILVVNYCKAVQRSFICQKTIALGHSPHCNHE